MDLTKTTRTHHVMLEVTTGCNMRCTYCAVSQPFWKPKDLDLNIVDGVVAFMRERQASTVILHGHGETTSVDGWHSQANKFIEADINLSICSNLSKSYSHEELVTLSKFGSITVSLDTIDPTLFRTLRVGGHLQQVIFNMTRIESIARTDSRQIRWIWSIVACDKTVEGLKDLVWQGISLGVKVFCFCNLTILTPLANSPSLRHLAELSQEEAKQALRIFDEIQGIGLEHGVEIDIKHGLLDSLRQKAATDRIKTYTCKVTDD